MRPVSGDRHRGPGPPRRADWHRELALPSGFARRSWARRSLLSPGQDEERAAARSRSPASILATAPASSVSTGSAIPRPRVCKQAAGLMVNYLYDLRTIEANHEAYANQGAVAASRAVERQLREFTSTARFRGPSCLRICSRSSQIVFLPIWRGCSCERAGRLERSAMRTWSNSRDASPARCRPWRQAGRSRGGAGGEKRRGAHALSRGVAGRRGLLAPQFRVHRE